MPQGAPCPCAAAVCCGVTPSSAASSPARVRPKGSRRSSSGTGDLPAPTKGCGAGVPGRATAPAQIVPPARAISAEPRRGRDGAMPSACPAILFQGGVAARLPSGCRSCSPSAVPGCGGAWHGKAWPTARLARRAACRGAMRRRPMWQQAFLLRADRIGRGDPTAVGFALRFGPTRTHKQTCLLSGPDSQSAGLAVGSGDCPSDP